MKDWRGPNARGYQMLVGSVWMKERNVGTLEESDKCIEMKVG